MSKEFETIILKKEEAVATIVINRPKVRNALNAKAFQEIREAIEECGSDKEVRAVILTGVERSFSSGADVTMLMGMGGGGLGEGAGSLQSIINSVEELPKPVIAAINGYALGAGLDLALACDFRIVSEDATLAEAYIRLGLVPDMGGTQRLPWLVGAAKAKELIFTGENIDGKEAERIGLASKAVPRDELESEAMELAKKLARGPSVAIGLAKMAINKSREGDLKSGLAYEAQAQAVCVKTQDVREGMTAFMEKRPAQFKGE